MKQPINSIRSTNGLRTPLEALLSNLEDLTAALVRFADEYQEDPRAGAGAALAACCQFLRELGLPPPVLLPLDDLLEAYHDLSRGCVVKLLEPSRVQARPPLLTGEKMKRAVAAAAVELEYRQAKGIEQACSTVATLLNQKLGLRRGRGFNWKTLKLWRDKVRDRSLQTMNDPQDVSAIDYFEHIIGDATLTAERLIQSLPLEELPAPSSNS
ncbi:MAG: hypothetical protein ACREVH_04705 [Gammaproteobacteria bacterium]